MGDVPLSCPDCGAPMLLREGKYGRFYGCTSFPDCDGTHGAHQAIGKPLGLPANRETRQARIAAHQAFDYLWRSERMTRGGAYAWLGKVMGLSKRQAHISRFSAEQCAQAIAAVNKLLKAQGVS